MRLEDIDKLMDGLADWADIDETREKRLEAAELQGEAMMIQGILNIHRSEGWEKFMEFHQDKARRLVRELIRADALDPFNTGKAFGQLELLSGFLAEADKLNERLGKIVKQLEAKEAT